MVNFLSSPKKKSIYNVRVPMAGHTTLLWIWEIVLPLKTKRPSRALGKSCRPLGADPIYGMCVLLSQQCPLENLPSSQEFKS